MDSEESINQEVITLEKNMKQMLVNRKDDYDYARDVLYSASERLQDILDSAVQLAQESEHPRAIEVATQTANSLADVAGKMMDHHIKTEQLNHVNDKKTSTVNNNVNVKLNSKDLLELLNRDN